MAPFFFVLYMIAFQSTLIPRRHVCYLFFAYFKNQTTRRTDEELGFIVQQKLNQVFEYSNNGGKNFKQLSSYLAYRWENKVTPPSMGSKNAKTRTPLGA